MQLYWTHRGVGGSFFKLNCKLVQGTTLQMWCLKLWLQVGTGYQIAGVVPKIMGSTSTGANLWVWVPKLSCSIWYIYLSYSFFCSS